jgi:hypothetical protein
MVIDGELVILAIMECQYGFWSGVFPHQIQPIKCRKHPSLANWFVCPAQMGVIAMHVIVDEFRISHCYGLCRARALKNPKYQVSNVNRLN